MNARRIFELMVLLLLVGCSAKDWVASDPVKRSNTNNTSMTVDLLFEHDGCKVYRFYDDGRYHYYTNCSGTTLSSYSEGKVTVTEEVPTR